MEREKHIGKLSNLVKLLGELSMIHDIRFWNAWGAYQNAKDDALKSRAVSKKQIESYDTLAQIHVNQYTNVTKSRIGI